MSLLEIFTGTKAEIAAHKTRAGLTRKKFRRGRLNSHDQHDFDLAEPLSRRLVLRRSLSLTGVIAFAIGAAELGWKNRGAFLPSPPPNPSIEDIVPNDNLYDDPRFSVSVENEELIGKQRAQQAIEAVYEWRELHGCERSIKIDYLPDEGRETRRPDGKIDFILELGDQPGIIKLSRDGIPRSLTLHAMSHACRPDRPTYLREPIFIKIGYLTWL